MAHYYFENTPHAKMKNGEKINTKTHYEYIMRENKYSHLKNREEDLVYSKSGNMPKWANNADLFWDEAEKNRRSNGRAYREIRMALQEELTLDENIELVNEVIDELGIEKCHAYSYAIHDKVAAFDKEHRNIHCHLMFSEKIIEPDRDLSASKYFNQYYENSHGVPTQGYRTDPYFAEKTTTFKMREKWADLVNKKFKEKGLECSVSEKKLDVQRSELLAQGKEEEAELLNRTPAPHLGNAYRNPKTLEKIRNTIKKIASSDDTSTSFDAKKMSKKDEKIFVFSQDLLIRRISRQIQQERVKLLKDQEQDLAEYEAAEVLNEPFVITVEQVADAIEEKMKYYTQQAQEKLEQYQAVKPVTYSEKQLEMLAKNRVFTDYIDNIRDYKKIKTDLDTLKAEIKPLYGDKKQLDKLGLMAGKITELQQEKARIGKRLASCKNDLANDKKAAFERALADAREEMNIKGSEAKGIYKTYVKDKMKLKTYSSVLNDLKNKDKNSILYSEKIPGQLNRHCKINGSIKLADLTTIYHEKESYVILDKIDPNSKNMKVEAVKLGDDIKHGKVPVYTATLINDNGKIKLNNVHPNYKEIRLYQTNSERIMKRSISNLKSIVAEAKNIRAKAITSKVEQIAKKFTDDRENLNGHFNDQENERKDKMKIVEEQMYKGWSL